MKILNVSKAIIINDRREVLLLKRSKTAKNRPGEWDFPGGHIDKGEDIAAAASREIAEETGLKVPVPELHLVFTGTTLYEKLSVNRMLFAARTAEFKIRLSREHQAFRWLAIESALMDFSHPFYTAGLKYAFYHRLLEI